LPAKAGGPVLDRQPAEPAADQDEVVVFRAAVSAHRDMTGDRSNGTLVESADDAGADLSSPVGARLAHQ